jgi:hypothetical protein
MTGNLQIWKPLISPLSTSPSHRNTLKHPIKDLKSRGSCITLDLIIFETNSLWPDLACESRKNRNLSIDLWTLWTPSLSPPWAFSCQRSRERIRSKYSRAETRALHWAGSSLAQVLTLTCLRTDDQLRGRNGWGPLTHENPNYRHLGPLPTPLYTRKEPFEVRKCRGSRILLDWIAFETGLNLVLHTNWGPRNDLRTKRLRIWESIYP